MIYVICIIMLALVVCSLALWSLLKEAQSSLRIRLQILDSVRNDLRTTKFILAEEQKTNKRLRGELAGLALDEILKSLEDGSDLSKFKVH